ncbi:MAG: PAS domain S-box protein, partial [Bacteroidales bacterium]|nr:PAS domain S-box protein [Bacteroidales bacterium]
MDSSDRCEENLNREKAYLEHIIESAPEAIAITDRQGVITRINNEFINLFGYTHEEAVGKNIDDLIIPDNLKNEIVKTDSISGAGVKLTKQTIRRDKYGKEKFVSLIVTSIVINNQIVGYVGIYRDISRERKKQLLQEILYNISATALSQIDMKDIYPVIVRELSKIWDTSNFFIALYDKKTETLSLPFFSDEKDSFREVPAKNTISKWVINMKRPVLLKERDIKDLENAGEIGLIGTPCKIWMGVPLKADNEIIGVMCLQDYHDENKYSQEDVNALEFVANQAAVAIQRRKMIDDVLMASRKAEEAAQSKQQFMSTMSHEIRTPLNEVIGITNLLLQTNPREDQMEYIKTLRFAANHLLTLVNDVLDYSKMESGKIVFEQTPFNLDDFLNDILRSYSFRSKAKNLDFEIIRLNEIPSVIIGDPIRLNQILFNLLSNAMKFTKHGGISILIRELERSDKNIKIEFSVKDTGIGIPKEKHT